MKKKKLFWRTDEGIRAPKVRVIGANGRQVGIKETKDAISLAKKDELTLVEIAPNAQPPVAKIVDFGKFRYAEEKKLRKQAKGKGGELKEVRLSPFIAQNDYQTRFERIKEFLTDKNKVKVAVVFKGRQLGSKTFGYQLLKRVLADLEGLGVLEGEPKFFGRHLIMTVAPGKGGQNAESKNA